jgi:O-antigen/teichoic acid export membrane protein
MASVPGLLFANQFGLARFAPYGVSQQVILICSGMAGVWMQVKWPEAGQLRARRDYRRLQELLWSRLALQCVTYLLLALGAIMVGPLLLELIASGKELLPAPYFILLAVTAFFDMQFTFWTTVISTGNRIPFLRSSLVWSATTLIAYLVLVNLVGVDYLALVVSQLLAGSLFCYWFWPYAGIHSIRTTPTGFLLRRSDAPESKEVV